MLTNHKYFLQFMINRSCVTIEELLKYMKKLEKGGDTMNEKTLVSMASQINTAIAKQKFEICFKHCEVTGTKKVLFINTVADAASKAQTKYSPLSIEYLQSIFKDIISSRERCVSMIGCMNLIRTLTKKLSRTQAEEYLKCWSECGYLYNNDNHMYLGPKFISEYTNYMVANCKDRMSVCSLCAESLFYGKVCKECNIAFHKHCLMRRSNDMLTKCPQCKTENVVYNSEHDINDENNGSEEEQTQMDIDSNEDENTKD